MMQNYIHRYMKGLSLVLLMAYAARGSAQQTVNDDIRRINLAMFEAPVLHLRTDYLLYFGDEVRSQMQGTIKKQGIFLYQEVGPVVTIRNKQYSITVFHDKQTVVLDHSSDEQISREAIMQINMDSVRHMVSDIKSSKSGQNKQYAFTLKRGLYSQIKVNFNAQSYFLTSLEMVCREPYEPGDGSKINVRMAVLFRSVAQNEAFSEAEFSEKQILTVEDTDKVSFAKAYKKYRLVNNLDKKIQVVSHRH